MTIGLYVRLTASLHNLIAGDSTHRAVRHRQHYRLGERWNGSAPNVRDRRTRASALSALLAAS